MRPSDRLQPLIWQAHVQLRKSEFLRSLVHLARSLVPLSRAHHMRKEVLFWRRWFVTGGLAWPDDYAMRLNPKAPVEDHLAKIMDRLPGQQVDLLDVGAGPLTVVGKVHPSKKLRITATDPLARDYDELLAEFGIEPAARTIFAEAEKLREHLGDRQFDIVHAQNSLDHSADPVAGLEQMLSVTRPGGFVVLLHEENEGRNELYHALHQWDFTTENGDFIVGGPGPNGPRRNATTILADRAKVECTLCDGKLLVVMQKSSS